MKQNVNAETTTDEIGIIEVAVSDSVEEYESADRNFSNMSEYKETVSELITNRPDQKSPKIPTGTDHDLVKQEILVVEPELSLEVNDSVNSSDEYDVSRNYSMQDDGRKLINDKKAEFIAKSEYFKSHPKFLISWCGNEEDLLPSENLPEGWGVKNTVTQSGRRYWEYVTPDRVFKLRSLVSVIEYLKCSGLFSQAEIQTLESKLKQN